MTLDKPVPWDQVLDLVLRMNQLGLAKEGDIVRIATLETLKKEDDLRKAKLEALKKAREDAKALEPLVTRYFPVSYANAKGDVQPHVEKILTSGRGSVTVDEKNNQLIVTDTAAIVRQAEQIISRIDKVTSQVVIEARVVEVTDNFSQRAGNYVEYVLRARRDPGIELEQHDRCSHEFSVPVRFQYRHQFLTAFGGSLCTECQAERSGNDRAGARSLLSQNFDPGQQKSAHQAGRGGGVPGTGLGGGVIGQVQERGLAAGGHPACNAGQPGRSDHFHHQK